MSELPVLLDQVDLGSARGGRKPQSPLEVSVLREISTEDLPGITAPPVGTSVTTVREMRAAHHRLAELVAKGTPGVEISAITGYSQAYISSLGRSPAFAELVEYYSVQNQQIYVDALERLKTLGLTSIEELQRRLDENPEKPSLRELMELVEMSVLAPSAARVAGKGIATGGAGTAPLVEIKFVGTPPAASGGPTIDVTPREDRG